MDMTPATREAMRQLPPEIPPHRLAIETIALSRLPQQHRDRFENVKNHVVGIFVQLHFHLSTSPDATRIFSMAMFIGHLQIPFQIAHVDWAIHRLFDEIQDQHTRDRLMEARQHLVSFFVEIQPLIDAVVEIITDPVSEGGPGSDDNGGPDGGSAGTGAAMA